MTGPLPQATPPWVYNMWVWGPARRAYDSAVGGVTHAKRTHVPPMSSTPERRLDLTPICGSYGRNGEEVRVGHNLSNHSSHSIRRWERISPHTAEMCSSSLRPPGRMPPWLLPKRRVCASHTCALNNLQSYEISMHTTTTHLPAIVNIAVRKYLTSHHHARTINLLRLERTALAQRTRP